MRFFPFLELKNYNSRYLRADVIAAFSVLFMAVPQGVAYAIIAGLPPVMGLYAAAIPAVVGALLRSSKHVIAGPTNALSLLYGAGIAQYIDTDPLSTAVTAAMLVGIFQIMAAVLGVGTLLSYISKPLLIGYVSGAGLLIGLGQLGNLTGIQQESGSILNVFFDWIMNLSSISPLNLTIAIGTISLILIIKKFAPKLPGPAIAMTVATLASISLNLQAAGLVLVQDLSPIPKGFPQLTIPDLDLILTLVPIALALTMLSLIESSSIAQTIGLETQQVIDNNVEFMGQGLANLSAAFCGGYPISGSLSRSKLNHTAGAKTRLAGVFEGLLMLLVLLGLSDFINYTPLCALAGLLMIVAWNLIDRLRIRCIFKASASDKATFLFTFIAMLTLSLDIAIYASIGLGLIISRLNYESPSIYEHVLETNVLKSSSFTIKSHEHTQAIRVIELRGKLFFAFAPKIQEALHHLGQNNRAQGVVIHFNTSHTIDYTVATTLTQSARALQKRNIRVVFSGLCATSREQLDNLQTLTPDLELQYMDETGNWDLEKHQKAQDTQK